MVFVGESLANITGGLYTACCHAVDRHSNPRLGIVYEMQPLGGRALEGFDGFRALTGRRRCASDAGVCVVTVGTRIDGLQGMSVMQVFSLPCSCAGKGHSGCRGEQGRGAAGCHGGSGGEDLDIISGGLEGCLLNYFLIKVLAEDASREEAESGDEEEEEGDKVARQFNSFNPQEDDRESQGDSQAAGDAGAGAADEEGGYTLYVMRPRCNTLSCARCRCHTATTSSRDSPAACRHRGSDGDGAVAIAGVKAGKKQLFSRSHLNQVHSCAAKTVKDD